jgi:hypothetical protein
MKAMRGRIALQKHFVPNLSQRRLPFREASKVRARPRAAFERSSIHFYEVMARK